MAVPGAGAAAPAAVVPAGRDRNIDPAGRNRNIEQARRGSGIDPGGRDRGIDPGGRDRGIDAARAVAIVGVVGGHWLVTGLVVDADGAWRQSSPLTAMPAFAPVSWVLQTLGLFFFTGGFAAARAAGGQGRGRPAGRLRAARLVRAVGLLLSLWAVVLGCAAAFGVPAGTLRTIAVLVVSPLWFLLPYLLLRAATGPLVRCVDRYGPLVAVAPSGVVVAASDAGLAPPWAAVPAAWSIPWVLGIALARGKLSGRTTPGTTAARPDHGPAGGLLLLIAGIGGMVVLVRYAGYPASAVGVPGQGRSNLNPPSLLAVGLAAAQIGLFLLIRAAASRRTPAAGPASGGNGRPTPASGRNGRPTTPASSRNGRPTTPASGPNGRLAGSLNRAALPIYLGHQSVLVAVVVVGRTVTPKGLLTPPDDRSWIMHRAAWLPILALVLAAVISPAWPTTRRARAD